MKNYLYIATIAIFALCSCTNENEEEKKDNGPVFYASIEDQATRTSLSVSNYVNWVVNDIVSINGVRFTATPENAVTATLRKQYSSDVSPEAPYRAFYPSSLYKTSDNPTHTLGILPSQITYDENASYLPMYAQSNSPTLTFKNICGVLAVSVDMTDIAKIKSIRISSANKAISGEFTVNTTNSSRYVAELTHPDDIENDLTLTMNQALSITSSGVTIYIPIPATTYRKLKIELSEDGSNYTRAMTTKAETDIVVSSNSIVTIDFKESVVHPDGSIGSATVTGRGAHRNSCNYVQLWENGPKWATFNIGASLTVYTSQANDACYMFRWGSKTNAPLADLEPTASAVAYDIKYSDNYDIARKAWGNNWQMPSKSDFEDMIENCTFTWCDGTTTQYASGCTIKGYKVEGKGDYRFNKIFLPAVGMYDWDEDTYYGADANCYYWTSTNGSSTAEAFIFKAQNTFGEVSRNECYAVRAILHE